MSKGRHTYGAAASALCHTLFHAAPQHMHTFLLSGSSRHLQACENVGLDQDQLIVTGKGGDLVYGSAEAVERGEWWPPFRALRNTAKWPAWSSSKLLHKQRQRPAAEPLSFVCVIESETICKVLCV